MTDYDVTIRALHHFPSSLVTQSVSWFIILMISQYDSSSNIIKDPIVPCSPDVSTDTETSRRRKRGLQCEEAEVERGRSVHNFDKQQTCSCRVIR